MNFQRQKYYNHLVSSKSSVKMVKTGGLVRCILCRKYVTVSNKKKFGDHMQKELRVYFRSDFILSVCKLASVNVEDVNVVKRVIDGMYEENMKLENTNVPEDKVDVTDSTFNVSTSLDEISDDTITAKLQIANNEQIDHVEDDLDAYATIPPHLLDEFQQLCDSEKTDDIENDSDNIMDSTVMNNLKMDLEMAKPIKNHKPKTFDCTKCGKSFELSVRLKKHMQNKHGESKRKSNECVYCKKSFKFEIMLKRHVEFKCKVKKKMKENKKFSCNKCDKVYDNIGNLNRHQRWAHKEGVKSESFSYEKSSKSASTATKVGPKELGKMKSRVFKETLI